MTKIMLLARDPGGANTIVPLVPGLTAKGYDVKLYGKDAALDRYKHFGLEGIDIRKVLPVIDVESWVSLLNSLQPDFIITGTSGDDFTERYLWSAARLCGIKSFAILDQWINYGIRFSAYTPGQASTYEFYHEHPYLPDFILVMDEEARQKMIREGIDRDRILISGQPYFDLLLLEKEKAGREKADRLRQSMGVQGRDLLVSFISEPLSQDYSRDANGKSYLGYDEKAICQNIIQTFNDFTDINKQRIHLVVKQHPRESRDNYQDLIDNNICNRLILRVVPDIDPWTLLLASDLVCGMSSMLLLESVLLGRPTISVQIGLKRENPLVLDKLGILKSILELEELGSRVQKFLSDRELPAIDWPVKMGAVDKVISYMEDYLCQC